MQRYWAVISGRAWGATCDLLGFTSKGAVVLRLLAAVVVVAVLSLWGSGDAAKDEIVARTALATLVIVFFPAIFVYKFVRAIPAYHAEATGEASTLRAQLEKKSSARALSPDQKASLADALRNSGCRPESLNVLYDVIDSECADFATDIGDAILMAGLECSIHEDLMYSKRNVRDRGINIVRGNSAVIMGLADVIKAQFEKFGMVAVRMEAEDRDAIFIRVARKDS